MDITVKECMEILNKVIGYIHISEYDGFCVACDNNPCKDNCPFTIANRVLDEYYGEK